ncbi:uncharacterized protein F5147DRAFT_713042 [Suillus discolor]|uniref:Uncharacterized protein n=1 Tax=Suillus discolor TaxID=1912936 RepID=A0A9P7F0X6_9AGAM|nr:uncharacterized protein F5147DRAFT_713042 [Suillus discolor]KAG2098971.1 hypothetical protein F5147DRAFT_713042 [Suillus discolor]
MNMDHSNGTRHLTLLNTSSSSTAASSLPSPPYSPPPSHSTPSSSAHARGVSPNDATTALKATRRQSSISYISSRVDVFSRHGTSTSPTVADASIGTDAVHGAGGLFEGCKRTSRSMKRHTMVGLEELRGLNAVGEARTRLSVGSASASGGVERAALTLAEKHADLLHEIAAAESRRLELSGQLAAVEGDLGELKRKWERIVNREPPHPILSSSTPTASVVGGLKEGVRLLAAGLSDLSDLSSPIPSPTPPTDTEETAGVPRRHTQRVSDSSASTSTRSGMTQFSRSSVSSVWDEDISLSSGIGAERHFTNQTREREASRARQEKVFRRRSRDLSHPPTAFMRHASSYNSTSTSVDLGRGSVELDSTTEVVQGTINPGLDASVTAVASEFDADGPGSSPSTNTLLSKRSSVVPPTSMPGAGSLGVAGGWGNVSRKLGGDVFSKSQKRASILLADVSQSIVSALTAGPVATSPAPVPTSIQTSTPSLFPFPSSLRTPSSSTTSLHRTLPSASSSSHTPSSNASSPLTRSTYLHTRTKTHAPTPRTNSWLEDEEDEDTVNAGRVLMPSVLTPTSASASVRKTPDSLAPAEGGTAPSFEDDDWNW